MDAVTYSIRAEYDVAQILVAAGDFANAMGFKSQVRTKIVTAVSELVRNVIKYADRGKAELRAVEHNHRRGMEIVVTDRGPGIPDVEAALRDHFSSGGTLGLGLPGVRRIVDEFELSSDPGKGTRVKIRMWLPS